MFARPRTWCRLWWYRDQRISIGPVQEHTPAVCPPQPPTPSTLLPTPPPSRELGLGEAGEALGWAGVRRRPDEEKGRREGHGRVFSE